MPASTRLFGGDGNDRLEGGLRRDFLTGGLGADQFHYVSPSHSGLRSLSDWIMDFSSVEGNKVNLNTVFSGTLSYLGGGEFTGAAGQPPGRGQGHVSVRAHRSQRRQHRRRRSGRYA